MNLHKNEVQTLKSEKETLENMLRTDMQESDNSLSNELMHIEDTMVAHYGQ